MQGNVWEIPGTAGFAVALALLLSRQSDALADSSGARAAQGIRQHQRLASEAETYPSRRSAEPACLDRAPAQQTSGWTRATLHALISWLRSSKTGIA